MAALLTKGKLQKGQKVLIHAGTATSISRARWNSSNFELEVDVRLEKRLNSMAAILGTEFFFLRYRPSEDQPEHSHSS
jgi:preprotein translocase subunit YajC